MTFRDKGYAKKLGKFLRDKRESVGLTQAEVAKYFKHSSSQFISNIERGLCAVPLHIMVEVLRMYKVSNKEFLNFIIDLEKTFWATQLKAKR
jgi:transcriptional regulator with XRE-family HTH domain